MESNQKFNQNRVRQQDMEEAIFSPKSGEQRFGKNLNDAPETVVYTLAGWEDDRINENGDSDRGGHPILFDSTLVRRDNLDGNDYEEDVDAENRDEACAKKVVMPSQENHRMVKYFIKRGTHGRFYNPVATLDNSPRHLKNKVGTAQFLYQDVNKRAFSWYIEFLRTKNESYLRNCEREVV